ncbi:hypothetical protein E2562_024109 [Oryza meyeriana var. granulata]|uniref:Uncharacterized protein n=1 Tax=Oryza meyeriana var. granulata TaxID=110450 RepID=A0A6G1CHX9_9ORYZ|nr:hypothetical protein E2562_024109 [Oryza meyeriana var. granulata]
MARIYFTRRVVDERVGPLVNCTHAPSTHARTDHLGCDDSRTSRHLEATAHGAGARLDCAGRRRADQPTTTPSVGALLIGSPQHITCTTCTCGATRALARVFRCLSLRMATSAPN